MLALSVRPSGAAGRLHAHRDARRPGDPRDRPRRLTVLFTSGIVADGPDETRQGPAGRARRARQAPPRDPLRERGHDAERLPTSAVTVTLGSYCQRAGGATTVTWCTTGQERRGAARRGARRTRSGATSAAPVAPPGCRDATCGVEPRGRSERHRRPDLRRELRSRPRRSRRRRAGRLRSGTYSYVVTALAGGVEVPGA